MSVGRSGVEMFKKSMDSGQAGDNVGLLLRGLKRDDILRGQVIAKPGSIKTCNKFEVSTWTIFSLSFCLLCLRAFVV